VWTGVDLCTAMRDQGTFQLPPGSDCGAAFVQLQPVMPQTAVDVRAGETFFVLDVRARGGFWGGAAFCFFGDRGGCFCLFALLISHTRGPLTADR
jgi:hypothetical protein